MTEGSRARLNNFDLLRFLLAGTVVLFHAAVLSGSGPLRAALRFANGHYAVLGFFAISGYVVSLSWQRLQSAPEFFQRRARRVLPGYLAVVLFCWAAGGAVSTLPLLDYWTNGETWRYLLANLSFLQFLAPTLPGVFQSNPVMAAVNGSLWSIRAELFCYLLMPLLAVWWRPAGLLACCLVTALWLVQWEAKPLWVTQTKIGIVDPIACFAVGVLMTRAKARRLACWGCAGAIVLAFSSTFSPLTLLEPMAVAAIVLAAAVSLPFLGNWPMLGNLSYGMYLWHFPLIQWLGGAGWASRSPWLFLAATIGGTLALAMLSWHLVEKRFLART